MMESGKSQPTDCAPSSIYAGAGAVELFAVGRVQSDGEITVPGDGAKDALEMIVPATDSKKISGADLLAAHFLETDLQPWHGRMQGLISQGAAIIALRGAGAATGIEPTAVGPITSILEDYVAELGAGGRPVVLISDGDDDNRQYPHVGAVFGILADKFADNPAVISVAVQIPDWYKPKIPGVALCSDQGTPYETYIFDEGMAAIPDSLKGRAQAHSALSQSDQLVSYPHYEQIVVGAAGSATINQLRDLSSRALRLSENAGPMRVTVLAAHNDPSIKDKLEAKLGNPDVAKEAATLKKLARHAESPYGLLCTTTGELAIDPAGYLGLSFRFRKI